MKSRSINLNKIKTERIKMGIKKLAHFRDFDVNETQTHWIFRNDNLQIKLKKSKNLLIDEKRCERVLNEAYGQGFTDSGNYFGSKGEPYCEYKVVPLNHDLEQKIKKKVNLDGDIIQIGNFVEGKSKQTGKTYTGIVQRFARTNYNDIVTVYILAREIGRIVALAPESVIKSSPYQKERVNRSQMDLGNSNKIDL